MRRGDVRPGSPEVQRIVVILSSDSLNSSPRPWMLGRELQQRDPGDILAIPQHRRSKYLDNRAENSHQPTRHREHAMKKFTSPGSAQRFLSAFSATSPHFRPRRHRLSADAYRRGMTSRFATGNDVVSLPTASAPRINAVNGRFPPYLGRTRTLALPVTVVR